LAAVIDKPKITFNAKTFVFRHPQYVRPIARRPFPGDRAKDLTFSDVPRGKQTLAVNGTFVGICALCVF
jgi:hypothetical protein